MWELPCEITKKKPNFEKLIKYGFKKEGENYVFNREILDGDFSFSVIVFKDKRVAWEIFDDLSGEEYTVAYLKDANGAFVGRVRAVCEEIFEEILKNCFETEIFRSKAEILISNYALEKYGAKEEFLWEDTPDCSIFRHKNGKWFAVILSVERKKLELEGEGKVEIINLKEEPEIIQEIVDMKKFFPAFHMNKKHWITICLDGSVKIEEIFEKIDRSYALIDRQKK